MFVVSKPALNLKPQVKRSKTNKSMLAIIIDQSKAFIDSWLLKHKLSMHATSEHTSPIGPALKYGAWKEKKREENPTEVEQIFRTRA